MITYNVYYFDTLTAQFYFLLMEAENEKMLRIWFDEYKPHALIVNIYKYV